MSDLNQLVPIVAIVSGLGYAWIRLKRSELEHKYAIARDDAAEQRAEKDQLKERVAVLEQIVTDRGIETANQIEALRAPRRTGDKVQ